MNVRFSILAFSLSATGCIGGVTTIDKDNPPNAPTTASAHCSATPRVLVSHVNQPGQLTVTGTDLFWSTNDNILASTSPMIMRAPIDGGAAATVVTRHSGYAVGWNLVSNGNDLYFGGQGLMQAPASGGEPTIVEANDTGAFAADENALYFALTGGGIVRRDFATESTTMLSTFAGEVDRIAIGGGHVFWVETHVETNPVDSYVWKELHTAPSTGGPEQTFGNESTNVDVGVIAANDTSVFWMEPGALKSQPVGGGPVTILATDLQAAAMVADSKALYVLSGIPANDDAAYAWKIVELPFSGGEKVLASGTSGAAMFDTPNPGIAIDDACIYWDDSAPDGTIRSVAK